MSADLGNRDDVQRVAARLASTEQPIDLLVNNAGFGVPYALTNADTTPHEHAIDVMIRAVLVLGAAAGRTMKARGRGTIINVSSTAGYVTMGGYSAVKAWVTVYSEGLANELRAPASRSPPCARAGCGPSSTSAPTSRPRRSPTRSGWTPSAWSPTA